jgi:hypothetical protein
MSPHKLLGGPGTPGILLLRRSLYGLTHTAPSTAGGGTVSFVNGFDEQVLLPSILSLDPRIFVKDVGLTRIIFSCKNIPTLYWFAMA